MDVSSEVIGVIIASITFGIITIKVIDKIKIKIVNLGKKTSAKNSGHDSVGGDKITINYNTPLGIGDPEEILGKKSKLRETRVSEECYSRGLRILNLSDTQVEKFGQFINDFYKKRAKLRSCQVTRNGLTMMKGAIFAVGTKDIGNLEWQEHCASSLREIFHEWNHGIISSEFAKLYKETAQLSNDEKAELNKFKQSYGYFSGIVHHEASKIMRSLQSIRDDESLKLNNCLKEQVFLEEVERFFSNLKKIVNFADKE